MNNFDFDQSKYSPTAKKLLKNSMATEQRQTKLMQEMPDITEDQGDLETSAIDQSSRLINMLS